MKKFLNRLEVERAALRLINSRYGAPQLCGITSSAIIYWSNEQKLVPDAVLDSLQSLSKKVAALSDRSGERFDSRYKRISNDTTEELARLKENLIEA